MKDVLDILISDKPLSTDSCYSFVLNEESGGVSVFVGTVRNHHKNQEVTHLEFEAYGPMAIKEMKKIAERCVQKFGISKIAIHHRTGMVAIKEIAVIIAVSSPHRDAAFKACRYAIDTLKDSVPIWKKEFLADGSHWVNAHP